MAVRIQIARGSLAAFEKAQEQLEYGELFWQKPEEPAATTTEVAPITETQNSQPAG
jgi:hypothetical protein